MARGDYYDITLRGEPKPTRVQATRVGATVAIDMGEAVTVGTGSSAISKPENTFITVTEKAQGGSPIRTCHFARTEVVAITQGTEVIGGKKK